MIKFAKVMKVLEKLWTLYLLTREKNFHNLIGILIIASPHLPEQCVILFAPQKKKITSFPPTQKFYSNLTQFLTSPGGIDEEKHN